MDHYDLKLLMLLLLNKIIKPLNQFAEKKKKSKRSICFWGYCWQFSLSFLTKYFPIFSISHKVLWTLALCKEKGTTRFGFILQANDTEGSNI